MAQKFYAVRAGRKPGIYMSWEACKTQVHGFAGAQYKSFTTREDADEYMSAAKCSHVRSAMNLWEMETMLIWHQ